MQQRQRQRHHHAAVTIGCACRHPRTDIRPDGCPARGIERGDKMHFGCQVGKTGAYALARASARSSGPPSACAPLGSLRPADARRRGVHEGEGLRRAKRANHALVGVEFGGALVAAKSGSVARLISLVTGKAPAGVISRPCWLAADLAPERENPQTEVKPCAVTGCMPTAASPSSANLGATKRSA